MASPVEMRDGQETLLVIDRASLRLLWLILVKLRRIRMLLAGRQ